MTVAVQKPARYPLCQALGARYAPLDKEAERAAPFPARFDSIVAFLIKQADTFLRGLREHQRAAYDLEDVMAELWVELAQKDHHWRPEDGRYITFAGTLAEHLLAALRDRSNTVQSPRNAGSRLGGYARDAAAGKLSDRKARTADKIRRTRRDYSHIDGHDFAVEGDGLADAEGREHLRAVQAALVRGMGLLTPYEAAVVGARAGLWGQPVRSVEEIADRHDGDAGRVRAALATARTKLKLAAPDEQERVE